eukprot:TRINITY_DN74143_c0_g1_i1.p1 TRINITY_DN74143_c0_g1~~TRINITY_DN74143_c0_g1_i1.p1  ORF type:complete len:545 (+),score=68.61 TRINITY_DN74143_c0_g1_i1:50-1684(+)
MEGGRAASPTRNRWSGRSFDPRKHYCRDGGYSIGEQDGSYSGAANPYHQEGAACSWNSLDINESRRSMHMGKGCGGARGKGVGKTKTGAKAPEDRGFQATAPGMYVRKSRTHLVIAAGGALELGNLEHEGGLSGKLSAAELKRLSDGRADIEVLCNRTTLLGNPFKMPREHAELARDNVCEAFKAYFKEVLRDWHDSDAVSTARSVGEKYKFSVANDWERMVTRNGPNSVVTTFEALLRLVNAQRLVGQSIRLMCHCVPKRCHLTYVAEEINTHIEESILSEVQPPHSQHPQQRRTMQMPSGSTIPARQPQIATNNAAIEETDSRSSRVPEKQERVWWKGAGMCAFAERPQFPSEGDWLVCLVEKRDGSMGFPKGRGEMCDGGPLQNAMREWREETNLSDEPLEVISEGNPIVDDHGCRYYVASWRERPLTPAMAVPNTEAEDLLGEPQLSAMTEAIWAVQDDPLDPDPIVNAYWISVSRAFRLPRLSYARKNLLRAAHQLLLDVWHERRRAASCDHSATGQAGGTKRGSRSRWRVVQTSEQRS